MKITIQTHDFNVRNQLTDFVQARVAEKLAQYGDRVLECQVMLKVDKSDTHQNKICEIKLVIPGNDLFASKQSEVFEDAVLKCVEAIRHQVKRWKDAVNNGKRRGSVTMPES